MTLGIAIHTYNRANYLLETLDGILNQTVPADEVILVDDGSTDDTASVVAPYVPRLQYVKISNVGCGASRHAAIERCQSDWIACCDDDDVWLPHHLEALQNVIRQVDDADFVFSNFRTFGTDREDPRTKFDQAPDGWWERATTGDEIRVFQADAYRDFLAFNPVFPSCYAIRKEFYLRIGGIDLKYSRKNSEDAELTRRMVLQGKAACTTQATVRIRRHDNNMSASVAKNFLGKAEALSDHLAQGIVPERLVAATRQTIYEDTLQALRVAYWNNDCPTMKKAYQAVGAARVPPYDQLRYAWACLKAKFRGAR